MFQTRFKCFKRVANIQNVLPIFAPACIPKALLIPAKKYVASISHRKIVKKKCRATTAYLTHFRVI